MKFINKKLFISGLIFIFIGAFINLYPGMVLNNLHRRYEATSLIDDTNLRSQLRNELTYHLVFWEKFSSNIEPLGILLFVLGILLLILALAWKFLE